MTVKNEALLPIFAEAKALPAPHAGRLTARRSPDELEIAVQRHHAADRQRHHHRLERIHEMGAVPVPQRREIQRPDTVVREDLPIPCEEARFVRPPGLRRERGGQEVRDIADALAGTARAASRTSAGAAPAAHRGLPRGARASSCPRRRKRTSTPATVAPGAWRSRTRCAQATVRSDGRRARIACVASITASHFSRVAPEVRPVSHGAVVHPSGHVP